MVSMHLSQPISNMSKIKAIFSLQLKTYFRVEILNHEIDLSSVRAYVNPPTGIQQSVKLNPNGQGMFVPDKYGMHEIQIEINEDKLVFSIHWIIMFGLTLFSFIISFFFCCAQIGWSLFPCVTPIRSSRAARYGTMCNW